MFLQPTRIAADGVGIYSRAAEKWRWADWRQPVMVPARCVFCDWVFPVFEKGRGHVCPMCGEINNYVHQDDLAIDDRPDDDEYCFDCLSPAWFDCRDCYKNNPPNKPVGADPLS